MKYIEIRFYEELNDFLPSKKQKQNYQIPFIEPRSVKDLIQSQGVPHTEVDLIIVNQTSVTFSYIVNAGDRIAVYPVFESFDITPINKLRPHPLRETKFVVDLHLGKLARFLRLLGFDTIYFNQHNPNQLIELSNQQKRIILTRSIELLKQNGVIRGCWIKSQHIKEQIAQLLKRFDLYHDIRPFYFCMRCNGKIEPIEKEKIIEQLKPLTRKYFHTFYQCHNCHQIYWQGSHYQKMLAFIQQCINNCVRASLVLAQYTDASRPGTHKRRPNR